MTVTCPYCRQDAELVSGYVIYPRRADLSRKKFWRCEPCGAYVGCHEKNKKYGQDGTQPLGRLANATLRKAKSRAHRAFDPLWQRKMVKGFKGEARRLAYAWLAGRLNIGLDECHIGMFDVDMCNRVYDICSRYKAR